MHQPQHTDKDRLLPSIRNIPCSHQARKCRICGPFLESVTMILQFVNWEPKGRYQYSKIFCWEPEGHYHCTYKVYGYSALLVLNRTSLKSDSALLALNWKLWHFNMQNKLTVPMIWRGAAGSEDHKIQDSKPLSPQFKSIGSGSRPTTLGQGTTALLWQKEASDIPSKSELLRFSYFT